MHLPGDTSILIGADDLLYGLYRSFFSYLKFTRYSVPSVARRRPSTRSFDTALPGNVCCLIMLEVEGFCIRSAPRFCRGRQMSNLAAQ